MGTNQRAAQAPARATATSPAPVIRDLPIETKRLRDLVPAHYNPRRIGDAAKDGLRTSLEKFGLADKIVWNRRSGRVVGGHQRLDILLAAGVEEAQVIAVDLDDAAEKAMNVALNNPLIGGEFTEELGPLLREIQEWDPDLFGELRLDDLELDVLDDLDDASSSDERKRGLGDPDAVPEPEEVPISRPGDLWLLGDHRLLCGDSTKGEDVARLMNGERAILFATDPPYLVDYDGTNHPGGEDTVKSEDTSWDDSTQGPDLYRGFIQAAIDHAIFRNAAWYCWHASRRQAMLEAVWEEKGAFVHQQIVWSKTRGVLTRSHYLWAHEPCFFGWVRGNRPPRVGDVKLSTVWPLPSTFEGEERPDHPTPKPIDAFGIPMQQHAKPGEVCYEPFSGSGTQLIAGETYDRRVFAVEKKAIYVDVAVRRWQQYTGRAAVLEATGQTFEEVERERAGATEEAPVASGMASSSVSDIEVPDII